MNPEGIKLSEIGQSQEEKYWIILLSRDLEYSFRRDRKQMVGARGWGRGLGNWGFMRTVSVWKDVNVLEMNGGDVLHNSVSVLDGPEHQNG